MRTPALLFFLTAAALMLLGPGYAHCQGAAGVSRARSGSIKNSAAPRYRWICIFATRRAAIPLQAYFAGRPVILALVYYRCPLLCNQVLNSLTRTLKVLAQRRIRVRAGGCQHRPPGDT